MILALASLALADPIAQRSPVDGDVVAVVGAPHQAVAWRLPADGGPRVTVSLTTRVPAAATDLSFGLSTHHGPETGWGWAAGTSLGVFLVRGPDTGFSAAPWFRVERRGRVHGGVQIAAPFAAHRTEGLRLPVVGETFVGGRRGRVHAVLLGGAGWAFLPATPAGALVVHGTLQVGIRLGDSDESRP